jgi:hypothetical protein
MSRTWLRRWAPGVVVYVGNVSAVTMIRSTHRINWQGTQVTARSPAWPACFHRAELALLPTPESAFHIAEFALNFRGSHFSPLESMFYIAKISAYLIEKQE